MDDDLNDALFGPRADPFAGSPRYVRVKNALTVIGLGRSKLYNLIKRGDIRAIKVGRATLIDLKSVTELFANAPQIAPAHHNTISAQKLGFTEAEPPADKIGQEEPLTGLYLTAGDLDMMSGGE